MAVNKVAPKTEVAAAVEEVAQSIALKLFRVKRYIRHGDPQVYEAGNVYEFDLAVGHARLKETDPAGFPIFTIYKPEEVEVAPRPVARAPVAPKRVRVDTPAPAAAGSFDAAMQLLGGDAGTAKSVSKIDISDDDPELAERLKGIDKDEDGAVAV